MITFVPASRFRETAMSGFDAAGYAAFLGRITCLNSVGIELADKEFEQR